eukprot:g11101.t1
MDSCTLGRAAITASREGIATTVLWDAFMQRGKELAGVGQLEPRDAAVLANAVCKVYVLKDRYRDVMQGELKQLFLQRMAYFNSTYLAMMLSAFGKCGVRFGNPRRRAHGSPGGIIAGNAVGVAVAGGEEGSDDAAASCEAERRLLVRELKIRAFADANVAAQQKALFERIADQAKFTIGEATPLEISRIIHSFARCALDEEKFVRYCLASAGEKLLFHTPAELGTVAYAFGNLLEFYREQWRKALEDVDEAERTLQLLSRSSLRLTPLMRIAEKRVFNDYSRSTSNTNQNQNQYQLDKLVRSRYIAHFRRSGFDPRWDDILDLLEQEDAC